MRYTNLHLTYKITLWTWRCGDVASNELSCFTVCWQVTTTHQAVGSHQNDHWTLTTGLTERDTPVCAIMFYQCYFFLIFTPSFSDVNEVTFSFLVRNDSDIRYRNSTFFKNGNQHFYRLWLQLWLLIGVPWRQPRRRSGLSTLPSVGAIPSHPILV